MSVPLSEENYRDERVLMTLVLSEKRDATNTKSCIQHFLFNVCTGNEKGFIAKTDIGITSIRKNIRSCNTYNIADLKTIC